MRRGWTIGMAAMLTIVVGGGLVGSVEEAGAIPAFARKYEVNCNVCHAPVPRLNPYGERFMENGYQLPGTEDGGIIGKKKLGELTINDVGNFVGFRVRGQSTFRVADYSATGSASVGSAVVGKPHDKAEFIRPDFLSMFVAGTVYKNIGFYVDLDSIESLNGGNLFTNRMFLTFNNIGSQLGAKNWAHIRVGRFDPSSFSSFPLLRTQLDVIFSDMALINNGGPVGAPIPFQAAPILNRFDLTSFAHVHKFYGLYNHNGFPISPFLPSGYNGFGDGIEIHGRPFGDWFFYQAGVINGSGENFRLVPAMGDTNRMKDAYGMIRFDFARADYFSASLSGFGYFGNNNLILPLGPGQLAQVSQRQVGVSAYIRYKMIDLHAAYSFDKISNLPALPPGFFDDTASGYSVALDVRATEQLLLSTRYDFLDGGGVQNQTVQSFIPATVPILLPPTTIQRTTTSVVGVQLKYYIRPNMAVMIRNDFNVLGSQGGVMPERNLRNFFTLGFDLIF